MNTKEVAVYLRWSRDEVVSAIQDGICIDAGSSRLLLVAAKVGSDYEISELDLDTFMLELDKCSPGRYPPAAVINQLLVEANHKCAICQADAPLEFHHIKEFSKIKHHDPRWMMALCGICHSKITRGQINYKSQVAYKNRLLVSSPAVQSRILSEALDTAPLRIRWSELASIVDALHASIGQSGTDDVRLSDLSLIELTTKNKINGLSEAFFDRMCENYESYFGEIRHFLSDAVNESLCRKYESVVDELSMRVAILHNRGVVFDEVLLTIGDLISNVAPKDSGCTKKLAYALVSFMYFNCDVGKKK